MEVESFSNTVEAVKLLEQEFNKRLISILDKCESDIVIVVYDTRMDRRFGREILLKIGVHEKSEMPVVAQRIYGANHTF